MFSDIRLYYVAITRAKETLHLHSIPIKFIPKTQILRCLNYNLVRIVVTREIPLCGREASNIIGAMGEIIAWDSLRKIGIWAYKIGSWGFFPAGYPYWRGELDNEHPFLTIQQSEFIQNKQQRARPALVVCALAPVTTNP